jgi:hypothetical protein
MNKITKTIIYTIIIIIALAIILETNIVSDYLEKNYHDIFKVTRIYKKTLPTDSIAIITSKDKYKVGEEIFFAIQNKTAKTLFIENECPWEPIEIYMYKNNVWSKLKARSEIIKCENAKEIVLRPYELVGASFLPWTEIILDKPGTYKLEVEIEGYKNSVEKEFEIVQ